MCEAMTGLPVLACIEDGSGELDMDIELLESLYEEE